MSTTPAPSAGMNCRPTIMHTRAGKSGRRKLKKKGRVLQMLSVVANTCMFRNSSVENGNIYLFVISVVVQ